MTKISIIAGTIARDEISDRAAEVKPAPFFNPLVMTEGQAYLTLVRDQALTLSQYYPENRLYRKAVSMADNALNAGISGCYRPYIGSVEPLLYPVARAIQIFKDKQGPAVRPRSGGLAGAWADQSLVAGELPNAPDFAIWWWNVDREWLKARKVKDLSQMQKYIDFVSKLKQKTPDQYYLHWQEMRGKYDYLVYVTNLYNDTIDKFAHHPLYNFVPASKSPYPAGVITKQILHSAGVQACANAGDFSVENMTMWTRNGILRANIAGSAGAISPELTCFQFTGLPDSAYTEWVTGKKVIVGPKKDKIGEAAIGNPVLLAILAIVSAALAYAQTIQQGINQKRATAFAGVQGWGTQSYSAKEDDWLGYKKGLENQPPAAESGLSLPMVAAGAAATYLLLSK